MGKRKYDSEKGDVPKKFKKGITIETEENDEQPQNVGKPEIKEKQDKPRVFDIKHFRKELASKQEQTMVLTQFLQVCLDPDSDADYILEYLKCGGNSHEILRQITAVGKKNLTLTTPAFHIFHLIILKVQSSLPHMIGITEEACRYFLNTFMSTVEIMISESSGPRHRKIVLKLLTSMVTLNSDLGIEVLNQAPLSPKHLQHIVEKCNYKEKDNVRTCFVHFMTSFLVEGHLPLIKALLEKQGLLGLVIPGLFHDEAEAVLMFLNILKKNVIDNALISKSFKLKTFNQHLLHNIFKIFSWKGPPEINYANKTESRQEIVSLLSEILVTLFTNHKVGLYFLDNSLGMSDANKNPNLFKALLSLKRPWENETECEVILEIVHKCPDLHRAIINVIEQSFEPKHSPIWEQTVNFTLQLLNKLKPEENVPRMKNLLPSQIANFVRFVTLPVPLLKFIQTNLERDHTISLYCIKVLVKMLQTLRRYMQILETNDSSAPIIDLKNRLEYFLPKHMPAPTAVVALIEVIIDGNKKFETNKDYTLPKMCDTDALISLIDLLLLYNDIHPTFFETLEGTIHMKRILDYSVTLSDGNVSLLKFKVVSLWLTLDSCAISLKNPIFKDLLRIMLDVYARNDDACLEAKDTLRCFFKNTGIFETDEDEIDLVLYTLRYVKWDPPSLIGDVVEYVLENIDNLSDYVRSQLVNFEIVDENSANSLKTLFDDLMQNRSGDDNAFMESKVPSPFIVGCIQYHQTHKNTTKNLKPFLSSYMVNLLHSNYSPELTEVLMGDCKLEARSYVANWTSQPVSLPDSAKDDDTLINISKSIIDNDNLAFDLTDIFPFLKESTEEDRDIILNETAYKFDLAVQIDSSELLIWAKYLIFCIVRLAHMKQFSQDRQEKIKQYFQCIISLCRKHHQVNVCRTILLSLLKNPHVLKIYQPLDLKGEDSFLATKFVLQVITDNNDIVRYLNKKHKVLNSYQQKNYNEIVKAFIKINKRKNVNSEHTIQVLNTVGLSDDDDERVFKEIFSTETSNCIRDDKEPSFVLELLSNLIDKYSRTVTLELQPQILRKCMILYTGLLTNKDITANLMKLEDSLAQYLENKPHQVNKVSDELLKKIFEANTIRKTTSNLAYVLLKNNVKFCNTFKEQISKPDILSQRELALPLGSAIICHKPFLLQNRELLQNYYTEYKSNINKMLEKPHKAGQVYITNWKFIRKLTLECMDLQDCEKLFSKSHKFESIELTHLHILQTIFLKLCTSENVKPNHLINYFSSMLHSASIALKEGKDATTVKDIVTNIYQIIQVTKIVKSLNIQKEEFGKITESAPWQNFCKAVLKDSLKVKTAYRETTVGPQLLCLLTNLVKLFYGDEHEDVSSLFDMVTSHSEFLNVMLSYRSSEIKSRLVEFLYTLILKNKSVMKTQQIPVYLSSYHATRSPCDRLILAILHHYEVSGLPVNEYKPYVWGESGANYYAVRKNRASSLWAHPTPNQVLNLFEKDIIERTVRNFPVAQKLVYHYELPSNIDGIDTDSIQSILDAMMTDGALKSVAIKDKEGAVRSLELKSKFSKSLEVIRARELVNCSHVDEEGGVYDPLFVLPLLSHLLSGGSAVSCFRLVRGGGAALPVAALAAACPRVRAAAYHVLHRFCMLLDTETRHKNDKLFLTDYINTLRRSLASSGAAGGGAPCPRLPSTAALYLARALMATTAPFDPLYKPVNNFLIAKNFVDLTVVPDFLSLFHDTDVESADRRNWILDIVKDGTKSLTDVNVVFKTMCLKMIMDYYSSVLSDRKSKEKILDVVSSLVAVPRAFEILVEGYGLISWLHAVSRQMNKQDKSLAKGVLSIIRNSIYSMKINSVTRGLHLNTNKGKMDELPELKINKDIENEILVILYDSYRNIEGLEIEDVLDCLKVYNSMTKRTIKSLSKNQIVNIIVWSSVGELKTSGCVSLLTKAVLTNDCNILRSKVMEHSNSYNLLPQLSMFVQAFLV